VEERPQVRNNINIFDGTPYEVKVSCTVWFKGKIGDNFKFLPIEIQFVRLWVNFLARI